MHAWKIAVPALVFVFAPLAAQDPMGDTIERVYKTLYLSQGEVDPGPFSPGDKVKIRFSLVNKSSEELRPPLHNLGKRSVPAVGVQQAWIERLGTDTNIPAIPKRIGRQGAKYAAGGSIILSPMEIKGKAKIDLGQRVIDTTDYPPGRYKLTMEYKELGANKVLQSQSVEFDLKK